MIHELYGIAIKFGYREIYKWMNEYYHKHEHFPNEIMTTNYETHNNLIHELHEMAIKHGYKEIYNYIDDYWNEHDREYYD